MFGRGWLLWKWMQLENFFKFLLSILEKLLRTDYSLIFLGEVISYAPLGAVGDISS